MPFAEKGDFYLLACRFVPYKRAELVVESFVHQPNRRLVVVGDGPCGAVVRAAARAAPNIRFAGTVARTELLSLMQRARALVFAAEEDFGITMVEAQACGTPVIAFGRGGAAEIVVSGTAAQPTGVLFDRQDPEAIRAAVDRFRGAWRRHHRGSLPDQRAPLFPRAVPDGGRGAGRPRARLIAPT